MTHNSFKLVMTGVMIVISKICMSMIKCRLYINKRNALETYTSTSHCVAILKRINFDFGMSVMIVKNMVIY